MNFNEKSEVVAATQNILTIKNLNFAYNNGEPVLRNVNLEFKPGKIYAILGRNGSGKSTLLHTISSILTNYEGEISLNFADKTINLAELKHNERAKLISLVAQLNYGNSLNVYDSVLLGRKPYINISPMMVDYEMTSRAIDLFNLNNLSLKATNELSGGELQSVGIARAFAQDTPIILLDEPTNNLDIKKQRELFGILDTLVKEKKLCVICVLHDVNHAMKYANELIFMKNGEVIKSGSKNIVSENLLNKVYDINAEIITNKKSKYIII